VPGRSPEDELNLDVMDALSELVKRATTLGQEVAHRLGLSVSDVVGLHKLEEPLTMKELGQRLHCDPSFVTMIANGLEKQGLAKRQTCERDRRIKNVVLTAEGIAMKKRLEQEFATRMPWAHALDVEERQCLLRIVRKMLAHAASEDPAPAASSGGDADGAGDAREGDAREGMATADPGAASGPAGAGGERISMY
jgi:MarR family transcriptional regulator, organic hydroperoxide resistance regulator